MREHLRVDSLDGRSWLLLSQVQIRQNRTEAAAESIARGKKIVGKSEFALVRFAESKLELAKGNKLGAYLGLQSLKGVQGPMGDKVARALAELDSRHKRQIASVGGVPGLVEPKDASSIPVVQKVRRKPASVQSQVKVESAPPKPSIPWRGSSNLSLTSGMDSNILQIADSLSPAGAGLGSLYSSLGLQGLYAGGGLGGMMSLSGNLGYTYNFSELASGLNNINAMAGLQWSTIPESDSRLGFSIGSMVASTFMQSGGYGLYALNFAVTPTLAMRVTQNWNADLSVSTGVNRFPGVQLTSYLDDRSGYQWGVNLGLRGLVGAHQLGAQVGYARQITVGPNFRTLGLTGALSWARELPWWTSSMGLNLSYASVDYLESDQDPKRADGLINAPANWNLPVRWWGEEFQFTSALGWTSASSTLESASFSNFNLNLMVVYGLF